MFTENYIEMVINNKQIQDLCKYKKGDWFWNGEKPYLYCKSGLGSSNPHDYKWLPTLEQLFGMINIQEVYPKGQESQGKDHLNLIVMFWDWFKRKWRIKTESLNEVALDFVMEILYNKSWNPEKKKWEEINGS